MPRSPHVNADTDPRLPNPERAWAAEQAPLPLEPEHVVTRVGAAFTTLELLSGGLANSNVLIDGERVLRIHRRDPSSAAKEAHLLRQGFRSFRVPRVYAEGSDFLVLEFVPHRALVGTRATGEAVGRALAEIHQARPLAARSLAARPRERELRAGLLGPDLSLRVEFDDVVSALLDYARSRRAQSERALGPELSMRVSAALEAKAPQLRQAAGPPALLHGDFKVSNLHWAASEELLVLDWEFAWLGPRLMDVGQLLRWGAPCEFVAGFAAGYRQEGGELCDDFERLAREFDLFNLIGLLDAGRESTRSKNIQARILETLGSDCVV